MISVIVPIYNVEKYLERCVKSIEIQTYKDFEIILVDDGSTDGSSKICDDLCCEYSNIVVIHKENGGLSDARNKGIENASGEYLVFIDSDDYIKSDMLEVLYSNLEKYDADISVCYFNYVDELGKDLSPKNEAMRVDVLSGEEAIADLDKVFVTACNKLYKKAVFNGVAFPYGKFHEDEYVIHRILYNARKIVVTNERLYFYVQHKDSIMGDYTNKKYYDAIEAFEERMVFLETKKLYSGVECTYRSYFRYLFSIIHGKSIQRAIIQRKLRELLKRNDCYKVPFLYRIAAYSYPICTMCEKIINYHR